MLRFLPFRDPLFLMLLAVAAGCGQKGPPRAAIEGLVTVSGQPLAAGRILFTPQPPTEGPASSARIVGGRYRLARSEGPVIGQNRVQVEADLELGFALDDEAAFAKRGKPLPPNPIPPAFNTNSTLAVSVEADKSNHFDISIPAVTQAAASRR